MPRDVEFLICSECGEEVEDFLYEKHWEIMHGDDESYEMSSSQRRLAKKQARGKSTLKIAGGAIAAVVILVAAAIFFLAPSDPDPIEAYDFQDTEKQPDIVPIPPDDNIDNGDGDQDPGTDPGTEPDPNTDPGTDPGTDPDPNPEPEPELAIHVPTSEITSTVKWYPYDSDGVTIRFFCGRSNDGEIHVAFDACDVCYKYKKGFRQEGVKMACNECDLSYPIKAIGSENKVGGCWPSYLPMEIKDDYVIIKITDLEAKKFMFE